MKKVIIQLVIGISVLVTNISTSAQYVTIPDTGFVSLLNIVFPSCMSGNQMDTTCTAITNCTNINLGFEYFTDMD